MNYIQLIVEGTIDEEKERLINKFAEVKHRLPMINSYVIEIPEENVQKLTNLSGIKAVHQNASITAQMNSARRIIHADRVQANGLTGHGITIAILDTGVSPVDDLTLPRNRIVAFKDVINGKTEPYDDNGHGTHVAYLSSHRLNMLDIHVFSIEREYCYHPAILPLKKPIDDNGLFSGFIFFADLNAINEVIRDFMGQTAEV